MLSMMLRVIATATLGRLHCVGPARLLLTPAMPHRCCKATEAFADQVTMTGLSFNAVFPHTPE